MFEIVVKRTSNTIAAFSEESAAQQHLEEIREADPTHADDYLLVEFEDAPTTRAQGVVRNVKVASQVFFGSSVKESGGATKSAIRSRGGRATPERTN